MSHRLQAAARRAKPTWTRVRGAGRLRLVILIVIVLVVISIIALAAYTAVELARFDRAEVRRSTLVYAAGQSLTAGVDTRGVDLAGTLMRLRYRQVGSVSAPGQFRRVAGGWEIYVRGLEEDGGRRPTRVQLDLAGERITRVTSDGQVVPEVRLEPEVLTSAAERPGEDYRPVRLSEVPLPLIQAVLAAEDHRFFEHRGLDARGLARAVWVNLRAGRVAQGGSTITQQLVKNRLLSAQRTMGRKLREAWLATMVEWRYPKEQILEAYLNEMYLGQRGTLAVRGMGSAGSVYFRKEIHQLTLAEAALLAGMIRAPNSYSPVLNPDRARQRRDLVLARMSELGQISERDLQEARRQPVRVQAAPTTAQRAPYFADYLRQELEQRLGDAVGDAGRIFTTLDLTLQRFAEIAVTRGLERLEQGVPRLRRAEPAERLQAALVVLSRTGQIRALVGGRDYRVSQFNRAVLARRQPGSAFKPLVYLAALRARRGAPAFTAASFVDDDPLTIELGNTTWSPRNYADRYEGRVTVRRALEQSLNAATVRIAQEIGLRSVIDTAREMGIHSALAPVPAMTLGAFEVTPLELAGAYVPLANAGVRPAAVTSVRSAYESGGNSLSLDEPPVIRAISEAEAYLMTVLLQGVMTSGTGAAARGMGLPATVAGKTGTTNEARDAWLVGYTPSLVALVWVGFDAGEPHGLSGAQAALPIWADFMRQALEAYPAPAFDAPAGITTLQIDTTNGRAANRFCPLVRQEAFLTGSEPAPCEEHGGMTDQITDWWRRFRDWLGR
jgi:penicillin-binding protein 1B